MIHASKLKIIINTLSVLLILCGSAVIVITMRFGVLNFWLYRALLIMAGVVVLGQIFMLFKLIGKKYKKNGLLEKWHDQTIDLMGVDWMVKSFDILCLWQDGIKIVNVSANKGEYDAMLANELEKMKISSSIYLFDKEKIEGHVASKKGEYNQLIYTEEKNAYDVNENLEAISAGKVDAIIDIKGGLWYAKKRTLSALKSYHKALNENGFVLIDAIEISSVKSTKNRIIGEFTGAYPGFAEVSTWTKFKRHLFKNQEHKAMFESLFDVKFYEISHNFKIACLIKK